MANTAQGSMQMSDDEIFRRKLLMDGEGMGDDRKLTLLLRNFFSWCDNKDETDDQIVLGYESLLASLENCEFLMSKSQQAQSANEVELSNYEKLESDIEKNIAEVQKTIIQKKTELKEAKKIREHKQQYDALAGMISRLPDRKETEAKLQALGDEINGLEKSNKDLETKIETRHKELAVLLSAAADLKQVLRDDEASSESD